MDIAEDVKGGMTVSLEDGGATFTLEVDGWYVDLSVSDALKVSAYIKDANGSDRLLAEVNIEDVDPNLWLAIRGMLNEVASAIRSGER